MYFRDFLIDHDHGPDYGLGFPNTDELEANLPSPRRFPLVSPAPALELREMPPFLLTGSSMIPFVSLIHQTYTRY
jgi:hypothetical protein